MVPQLVDSVIDRLDLTDLVLERVDLRAVISSIDLDEIVGRVDVTAIVDGLDIDAVAARVDVQKIVDRLDLVAIAEGVIDALDLPAIIRGRPRRWRRKRSMAFGSRACTRTASLPASSIGRSSVATGGPTGLPDPTDPAEDES